MADLYGTVGADSIVGSASENEYISGGLAGNEIADVGNDTLVGNGYDTVDGLGGDDSLSGSGNLHGGVGNDTIVGIWFLYGEDGDDRLVGEPDIRFPGSRQASGLYGGGGTDTLIGSSENDYLDDGDAGNSDADSLSGRGGDDVLESDGGPDNIDGGAGNDIAYIFRGTLTVGFRFTPADAGTAYIASDGTRVVNVESFLIYGGRGDMLGGLAGVPGVTDGFVGGGGNDIITREYGAQANGNQGNDTISIGEGGTAGSFLYGGTEAGSLVGSVGDDKLLDSILYGEDAADTLLGGLANDYIQTTGGADRIDGGGGHDVLELGRAGLTASFTLKLKGAKATTTASDGTTITGIENIYVTGGSSRDKLTGNRGDDTLSGGTVYATCGEKDVLTGGDGADAFRWETVKQLGENQPKTSLIPSPISWSGPTGWSSGSRRPATCSRPAGSILRTSPSTRPTPRPRSSCSTRRPTPYIGTAAAPVTRRPSPSRSSAASRPERRTSSLSVD